MNDKSIRTPGESLRAFYKRNFPGMLKAFAGMFGNDVAEVQELVGRICNLARTSLNSDWNPERMRQPLEDLLFVLSDPLVLAESKRYDLILLIAQNIATVAQKVVNLKNQANPQAAPLALTAKQAKPSTKSDIFVQKLLTMCGNPICSGPVRRVMKRVLSTKVEGKKEEKVIPIASKWELLIPKEEVNDYHIVNAPEPQTVHPSERKLLIPKKEVNDDDIVNDPEPQPVHPSEEVEENEEVSTLVVPKREILSNDDGQDEEAETPVIGQKRRGSLSVADLADAPAKKIAKKMPGKDKIEPQNSDDSQKKKCDNCHLVVPVNPTAQLMHVWKKHKNLVYKHILPELVCTVDYCDYVGASVNSRKIHVGKIHGKNPDDQDTVVSELEAAGKCPYCNADIDSIVSLKQHMCADRDERPMLGCSSCPDVSFHFIVDFAAHLKIKGGVTHGKPILLADSA